MQIFQASQSRIITINNYILLEKPDIVIYQHPPNKPINSGTKVTNAGYNVKVDAHSNTTDLHF